MEFFGCQEMLQCKFFFFFLTPNRKMFAGNFFKSERFLAALWKYVTFNVKWFEVLKISEVFWAKLYSQKSDLFSLVFVAFETFCYKIWNQKKKKKKSNGWWCPTEHVDEYKTVICPKWYFQEKNSKYEILNHFLVQIFFFGDCFRVF